MKIFFGIILLLVISKMRTNSAYELPRAVVIIQETATANLDNFQHYKIKFSRRVCTRMLFYYCGNG